MEKLVFILAIASLSVAQQFARDPKEAAILSEKRYLSNNGQFGSAFTQEDGVQFTEEADQDGNRRGQYSYIDPTGVRRTITYTAGKNGFQASGDHLPVGPQAPAAPAPVAPQAPVGPSGAAPVSNAARQFSASESTEEGQYHAIYDDVDYWERQSKSRPAASAPAPVQQQWSAPASAPVQQQWSAPTPAPQTWSAPAAPAARSWNEPAPVAEQQWSAPAPASQQWSAPASQQWSAPASQQWSAPAPAAQRSWAAPAPAPAPQQWNAPAPAAPRSWSAPAAAPAAPQSWELNSVASTEAPHRFFPPGKLDLNRASDGFSFSFSKS